MQVMREGRRDLGAHLRGMLQMERGRSVAGESGRNIGRRGRGRVLDEEFRGFVG